MGRRMDKEGGAGGLMQKVMLRRHEMSSVAQRGSICGILQ